MRKLNMTKLSFIAAALLTLSACSSGPSESDIHKALQAEFDKTSQMMKNMSGGVLKADFSNALQDVTSHGCEQVDGRDGFYECDIEAKVKDPLSGNTDSKREVAKFYETDDGWKVTK